MTEAQDLIILLKNLTNKESIFADEELIEFFDSIIS